MPPNHGAQSVFWELLIKQFIVILIIRGA